MNLLDNAIRLATEYHSGQLDKCNQPYILHPIRVMLSMNSYEERIVAVLHDIVEDTDMTIQELYNNFPINICIAINALTHKKGTPYCDYLLQFINNPLAITVKIADINDNISPIRLLQLAPETRIRLRTKYTKALNFLDNRL